MSRLEDRINKLARVTSCWAFNWACKFTSLDDFRPIPGSKLMDARLGNGGGVRTVLDTPITDTIFILQKSQDPHMIIIVMI
jgi:hypothetical protein